MTFLGESNEDYEYACYSIFILALSVDFGVAVSYAAAFRTAWLGAIVAFLMIFENSVLLAGDRVDEDGALARATGVVHAFIIPLLLVYIFELAYQVHKRRSVKFCGITFDEGHRKSFGVRSFLVRRSTQLMAVVIVALNLVVNLDLLSVDDEEAGRAGYGDLEQDENAHIVFAIVPSIILAVYVAYVSAALWLYGSNNSMTVYTSFVNPWGVVFVGGIAQMVGQIFNDEHYPVTSNGGETVLLSTIAFLIPHITRDLEDVEKFAKYLEEEEESHKSLKAAAIAMARSREQDGLSADTKADPPSNV